ncbi:MAG: hypothetical protein PHO79_08630 [Desulfoplanes sp.]|nr:hypothetical protein [Desulfoplanes sp.]
MFKIYAKPGSSIPLTSPTVATARTLQATSSRSAWRCLMLEDDLFDPGNIGTGFMLKSSTPTSPQTAGPWAHFPPSDSKRKRFLP